MTDQVPDHPRDPTVDQDQDIYLPQIPSPPQIQYHPVAQTRMEVLARLQNESPKNDFGLPIFILDPQHVTPSFYSLSLNEQAEILSLASVPIDYAEGFPTVEGNMVWERLPFEPEDSYHALAEYIKLEAAFGYRALSLLTGTLLPDSVRPNQTALAEKLRQLREYYVYYSWGMRVKAYDMLHHVAYSRRRERRAMEIEDYHYIQLEKIAGKLIARFGRFQDGDWDSLDPSDAIKALKEIAQLQRVAAGLPAHGPQIQSAKGQDEAGATIEQRLRKVALRNNLEADPSKTTVSETEEALRSDPQVMAMAQELIVTMAKKTAPPSNQPGTTTTTESPRESFADETEGEED